VPHHSHDFAEYRVPAADDDDFYRRPLDDWSTTHL